jgi:hypothetical protein
MRVFLLVLAMSICISLLAFGTHIARSASGYQLAVQLETEQYRQPANYDPKQVRFRLTVTGYSNSTDIPACSQRFVGSINVDFEITMQNGSIVTLSATYQSETGFSWMWTWTPFISMADDLWILRVSKITSNPVASFTAVDNLHLIRKRSLLLAIHSDYYNKFTEDMPHFADIVGEAYEHMVSLTGVRTPLGVVLSTLYRCTVASETACYVAILTPRSDYSPFSEYMRNDAFIGMIFHEMTHSIMTSNNFVFSTLGSGGYRNWFDEGLADYMGSIEVPRYFGSRADEFLSRNFCEGYLVGSANVFSILLENKGNITNNKWRTTPDAGKLLQQADHPEFEAAGMLHYFEDNYRPDFVRYFYKYVNDWWKGLPPVYQSWSQVWTSQVDPYARDTILANLLSKAVCADLTPFWSGNLSFQLYGSSQLQTQVAPDVYNSYLSVVGDKSTFLSLQPAAARPGRNVTFLARLSDAEGNPLANQQVDFYVGSSYLDSNFTDTNGTAAVRSQAPATSLRIMVCYGGESGYTASLNQTNMKILNFADVNEDGKVNILDITIVAKAFGAHGPNIPNPGDPASQGWNQTADLNSDTRVNILDVTIVAKEFGKTT